MFVRDMLAGAFSPVSRSTQRGQALLQHSMQIAHAGSNTVLSPANTNRHGQPLFIKQHHGKTLYYCTNSAICANRAGSHKGRDKLIRKKGLNIILNANVLSKPTLTRCLWC